MTETGSTVELRKRVDRYVEHGHGDVFSLPVDLGTLKAVLAVVEAAQDVRENSKQAIGMEDPWGSQGPPILVSASMWFALADKLDALHTQASDEGASDAK